MYTLAIARSFVTATSVTLAIADTASSRPIFTSGHTAPCSTCIRLDVTLTHPVSTHERSGCLFRPETKEITPKVQDRKAHDTCPDLRGGQCFAVMCKRRQLIMLRGLKLMQLKAVLLSARHFK